MLPLSKTGCTSAEVRQLIIRYLNQFLTTPVESADSSLMSLWVMNSMATEFKQEIAFDNSRAPDRGASFAIVFESKAAASRVRPKPVQDASVTSKEAKTVLDVPRCIQSLTTPETLEETEMWYCNVCKQHKQATKKFDLWKLPDILIIHLKRFSSSGTADPFASAYTRYGGYGMSRAPRVSKIDAKVEFPLEGLDLSQYTGDSKDVYDLYAVSNHYGSMGGGHYTAFAKNLIDRQWYELDDSRAKAINSSAVVTKAAFVLFYARRARR
jgi:hypothetical protein